MLTYVLKISIPYSLISINMYIKSDWIVLAIQVICRHLAFLILVTALQPLDNFHQKRYGYNANCM